MTRGVRNNNPGNIRHDGVMWKGEIKGSDRAFKTFGSMAWGVRAIFHLLNNYQVKYGLRTIEQMVARWAPPQENDTAGYVESVSRWSGVPRSTSITTTNRDVMIPVVAAMIRMENGQYVPVTDLDAGWKLFMENKL